MYVYLATIKVPIQFVSRLIVLLVLPLMKLGVTVSQFVKLIKSISMGVVFVDMDIIARMPMESVSLVVLSIK